MITKRVHVNKENLAAIKCPHCGTMKLISVAKFKGCKHSLKVKCTCSNNFAVSLNFRERYRKSTDIDGKYGKVDHDIKVLEVQDPKNKCKIADLSLSGVALSINGAHDLQIGDDIMVSFTLDDTSRTDIKRLAKVRVVGQGFVGCKFDEVDSPLYDKALGFYLMP